MICCSQRFLRYKSVRVCCFCLWFSLRVNIINFDSLWHTRFNLVGKHLKLDWSQILYWSHFYPVDIVIIWYVDYLNLQLNHHSTNQLSYTDSIKVQTNVTFWQTIRGAQNLLKNNRNKVLSYTKPAYFIIHYVFLFFLTGTPINKHNSLSFWMVRSRSFMQCPGLNIRISSTSLKPYKNIKNFFFSFY